MESIAMTLEHGFKMMYYQVDIATGGGLGLEVSSIVRSYGGGSEGLYKCTRGLFLRA